MGTMKLIIAVIALGLAGCGKAPESPPSALIAPAASPSPISTPVVETVCGISLTLNNGQVFNTNTGAVILNGSYSTSAYMFNGFYIPACNYSVLDGQVCVQGTSCGGGGW